MELQQYDWPGNIRELQNVEPWLLLNKAWYRSNIYLNPKQSHYSTRKAGSTCKSTVQQLKDLEVQNLTTAVQKEKFLGKMVQLSYWE